LRSAENLHVEWQEAQVAQKEDVLGCHSERLWERIMATRGQKGFLDPDTVYSPETYRAALYAAGAGPTALRYMKEKGLVSAFLPVRPPGHHATPERAMGFCFFNNVAITARYAQKQMGFERVLIVDWDVHHGNGTQEIFYSDPTVFYYSLHLWPHYPGTGREDERGLAAGEGYTLNRPLRHGFPAEKYLELFTGDVEKIVATFNPDLFLISCGFDSHRDDPLGGLDLRSEDYQTLSEILRQAAGKRPILSLLEGGYNLERIGEAAVFHVRGLSA